MKLMFKHIALTLIISLGASAVWAAAAAAPGADTGNGATGISAVLGSSKSQSSGDDFLPPDEAFRFDAIPDGPDKVRLNWEIAEGYYLYRARVKVATTSDHAQLGQIQMPAGQIKTDEYFGKQEVYHHELVATVPVARAANAPLDVPLEVTYQGCADAGLCYPPIKKMVQVTLPSGASGSGSAAADAAPGGSAVAGGGGSASFTAVRSATGAAASPGADAGRGTSSSASGPVFESEQDHFAALVRSGNIFIMLGGFFVAGLILAFTPCVLPMIPILSGIILGDGKNVTAGRSFALSVTYVLGMAFTYTIAGAACAAAGMGKQMQAFFQQPWILAAFAGLFVVLALSMFGLFTLQMPVAIQTRISNISNRQSAGTFGGVAAMGVLSALIVTTCVAPALVGALLVISQTGQIARGAAALFVMSIGMGTPLLVVGASQGKLLPKAGPWMDTIKKLFGVMMLGVAAWMLARVVPDRVSLVLWAIPALSAAWVLVAATLRTQSLPGWGLRTIGVAAGLYGIALVAGSVLGGTDPLSPIPGLAGPHQDLPFRTIKSVEDLQREVAQAKTQGRTVLVDFYADWCTSCKEMEKYTFSDASVQTALSSTVLLRADVTRNDADDQALLKHFGIFGPPTIAFYGLDGEERSNYRVVGYMKAAAFAARAREAFQSPTKLSDGVRSDGRKLAGTS